jgi:hypothetical protein
MGKKLTSTDYLIAFLFIFMFFCIIVAFFYGVNVGKTKAAEEYELKLRAAAEEDVMEELSSYHQQHLASFYYNVYYPFRTFQTSWVTTLSDIASGQNTSGLESIRKLSRMASDVYSSVEVMSLPNQSPLLKQAQTNYLRALRLFQEADKRAESYDASGRELVQSLLGDAYITEAIHYAAQAQADYYEAIVRWHDSVVVELEGIDQLNDTGMSLDTWFALPFNVQNSLVANALAASDLMGNYTPQDMTAVLASMIDNGTAGRLGLGNLEEAVKLLHDTHAVRSGDYFTYKDMYFQDDVKPQLPFYFEPQQ